MKGIGRLFQFGIAKESVRGIAETAADFWIPWDEVDLDEKYENVTDEQSRGVIEGSVGETRIKNWTEGNVRAPVGDRSFGLFLLSVLGTVNTTVDSPEAGVNTHVFSVAQHSQHQSLSLFLDDPLGGQDYRHALGVIPTFELAYERGRFISFTAALKARQGETTELTPSTTSENRFTHPQVTFKVASAQAGLDDASELKIKSLNLTFDKQIEDDDVLSEMSPEDFLNKSLVIEGTLEATWQNESDFKTTALSGAAKAMRIDVENGDVVIGSATNPRLRIDLHKVVFTEITRPVRLNDVVMQTLSFKAHYNLSDSKMVSAELINTHTNY